MPEQTEEIVMAGFGGQGILFLGKILAELGMKIGFNVSWIPSYGPEMRGGTANCSVVLSNVPISSPIVNEPDTVIAMNRPSVARFNPKIKKAGMLIYNSSLIEGEKIREDIKTMKVPASEIADQLGNAKVANLVMAGAYVKFSKIIDFSQALKLIPQVIPAKKKELAELNLNAFKKGYECVELVSG
jgi:2-oxoglutarate ferredoxin oxidoreductase subunit gamma